MSGAVVKADGAGRIAEMPMAATVADKVTGWPKTAGAGLEDAATVTPVLALATASGSDAD